MVILELLMINHGVLDVSDPSHFSGDDTDVMVDFIFTV